MNNGYLKQMLFSYFFLSTFNKSIDLAQKGRKNRNTDIKYFYVFVSKGKSFKRQILISKNKHYKILNDYQSTYFWIFLKIPFKIARRQKINKS